LNRRSGHLQCRFIREPNSRPLQRCVCDVRRSRATTRLATDPKEGPMSYRPGDTIHLSFTTQSAAGAATDADTTPTGSMRRNGAIDGAVTIAMTHNGTGDYTASATLPLTYVAGDDLELLISVTVGGVAGKGVLP